jgi:hypothetical protein
VVERLLAAGAAVNAKDKVRGVGGRGQGRDGWQNTALRVLLVFLFCASQHLGLRSLSGFVRKLVTSGAMSGGSQLEPSIECPCRGGCPTVESDGCAVSAF